MTYDIIISNRAQKHAGIIFDYISLSSSLKAVEFSEKLLKRIHELKDDPKLGPPINSAEPLRRKLTFKQYVIRYRINEKSKLITVLSIRHSAQKPLK